jgi:hypothetical protein
MIDHDLRPIASNVDAMICGVRLARKLAEQPALEPYIAEEVVPGAGRRELAKNEPYCYCGSLFHGA